MSIDIIAHWGPREETPEQVANCIVEWIEAVGQEVPSLRQWYKTGLSRSAASKQPIEVTPAGIMGFMSKRNLGDGLLSDDAGREGIFFDAWNNAHPEANITIMAASGIDRTQNSFTVDMDDDILDQNLLGEDILVRVFERTLLSWQPAVASLGTSKLWDSLEAEGCSSMDVGWITYVRDLPLNFNNLPEKYAIATRFGQGWMIRLIGSLQEVDASLVLGQETFFLV